MEKSEQIDQLATALAAAQAKIRGAQKDRVNPHFKNSYADLASVWDACREQLTEQGLSVSQLPSFGSGHIRVTTVLMHKSGQFLSEVLELPITKSDPQACGSAITYARRYALAAIAGVCPDDDDGEGAMRRDDDGRRGPQQEQRPHSEERKQEAKPIAPQRTEGVRIQSKDRELHGRLASTLDTATLARHLADVTTHVDSCAAKGQSDPPAETYLAALQDVYAATLAEEQQAAELAAKKAARDAKANKVGDQLNAQRGVAGGGQTARGNDWVSQ